MKLKVLLEKIKGVPKGNITDIEVELVFEMARLTGKVFDDELCRLTPQDQTAILLIAMPVNRKEVEEAEAEVNRVRDTNNAQGYTREQFREIVKTAMLDDVIKI